MSPSPGITVYSRPGCHLCEAALAELAPMAADAGASLVEVNIDDDDDLLKAHLERIPVVMIGGREICTLFVDKTAVRAALS